MLAPNVLLLDEPTNDLDIATLNILEDYLDEFNGIVITVSHDRYFLDRICNKIFAYEGIGKIHIFTGNYSDYSIYREIQGIEFKEEVKESPEKTPLKKEKPQPSKKLKYTYHEQRELETSDSDIEKLEQKIEKLENDSIKFATDFVKLQEILNEKTNSETELEHKYERWEYLNNLAEEIENSKN